MKKILRTFVIALSAVFLFSCASKETPETEPINEIPQQIEETEITEEPVQEEVEEIPVTEEIEEPQDEIEFIEFDEEEDEYYRSIDGLDEAETVTREEFTDDKSQILTIINELSAIMETQNYDKWLKYIEPESIEYYSNPVNLRKAQKKHPNKTIQLKGMRDYFKYVFIPSRQRSQVDEIRYISKTSIKAVQVKADFSTVVYYHFTKIDNKWYVRIPPIS